MKLSIFAMSIVSLGLLASCAGKPKYNDAMLEKYPGCYHDNFKIYQKCIQKNEAGEKVTAVELENTAYPGQYN
ncbi:MAG: hypothetical protein HRT45_00850 [Bdellovibrionales bacterium]|nr:hypothetical protein [Bdellovibrionales bacterium]